MSVETSQPLPKWNNQTVVWTGSVSPVSSSFCSQLKSRRGFRCRKRNTNHFHHGVMRLKSFGDSAAQTFRRTVTALKASSGRLSGKRPTCQQLTDANAICPTCPPFPQPITSASPIRASTGSQEPRKRRDVDRRNKIWANSHKKCGEI